MDFDPRIESSWSCGGMQNPRGGNKPKKDETVPESPLANTKNRLMTYIGNPYITLRAKEPLPFIISEEEAKNEALEVPFWKYDPRTVLIAIKYRRVANIPGKFSFRYFIRFKTNKKFSTNSIEVCMASNI